MHELSSHVSIPVGSTRGDGCIGVACSISKTLKIWLTVDLRETGGDGFFGGLVGRMLLREVAELGERLEISVEIDVVRLGFCVNHFAQERSLKRQLNRGVELP